MLQEGLEFGGLGRWGRPPNWLPAMRLYVCYLSSQTVSWSRLYWESTAGTRTPFT